MDFGILTIALGHEKYLRQAEILLSSLRRNVPTVPLAVVTDSERFGAAADIVIPPLNGLPIGVVQKVFLDHYTPFKETLFIDSDCIVTRPFPDELEQIRSFDFTPAIETVTPADGEDEYIDNLPATLRSIGASSFPKFNGGVYFFREGNLSKSIFTVARDIHANYRQYGIKAFDNSGPGEETVFALALAKLGVDRLYHDGGRLMRTPTGLKGRIHIEPLGGGCSFERFDGVVSPAICHFAGPYLLRPEYRLAAYSLAHQMPVHSIDLSVRLLAQIHTMAGSIRKYINDKIRGARKRLGYQAVR
ncbi:hypothetical protein [Bradyrhizobium sp. CCBAU 11386]|uniref:hypothetical protein n=1 Tax=Bradyrhizobium sp. CCBAU 11386 TaxID=1630837 RepID=UPI0023045AC4|nr:hypothetical protein [Bradyrhizobium sp. CCBAU 11386]